MCILVLPVDAPGRHRMWNEMLKGAGSCYMASFYNPVHKPTQGKDQRANRFESCCVLWSAVMMWLVGFKPPYPWHCPRPPVLWPLPTFHHPSTTQESKLGVFRYPRTCWKEIKEPEGLVLNASPTAPVWPLICNGVVIVPQNSCISVHPCCALKHGPLAVFQTEAVSVRQEALGSSLPWI